MNSVPVLFTGRSVDKIDLLTVICFQEGMVSLSAPYNEPPDARLMWPGKMILPVGERKRFLTFLHLHYPR